MGIKLSYQQRVLLSALAIVEENSGKQGYEFHKAGNDLILTPWVEIEGRGRVYSEFLRVTKNKILGRDEAIISELEEMANKEYNISHTLSIRHV